MTDKLCTVKGYLVHIVLAVIISIVGAIALNLIQDVLFPYKKMKGELKEIIIHASIVGIFHGLIITLLICLGLLS